jgi:hypothetical protein
MLFIGFFWNWVYFRAALGISFYLLICICNHTTIPETRSEASHGWSNSRAVMNGEQVVEVSIGEDVHEQRG